MELDTAKYVVSNSAWLLANNALPKLVQRGLAVPVPYTEDASWCRLCWILHPTCIQLYWVQLAGEGLGSAEQGDEYFAWVDEWLAAPSIDAFLSIWELAHE